MAARVGSMEPLGSASVSATTPRLAWKWILEKLVDLPDFGVGFFNEVITAHVPDIEEPHCRPLLERVALRNLEEMVVTHQIGPDAIPCLKALTGQDSGPVTIGSSVKQRYNKELVLRVQTEVVLSVLRNDVEEEEKDWARYESELESVFGEAEEDNRLLDRKRELSALLKPKNQTKANVAAYLEKYSLKLLRDDLCLFIGEKRESFKTTFLDQLSRDFRGAHGPPFREEVGDKEKSTELDANAKQDEGTVNVESSPALAGTDINEDMDVQEVGQNRMLDETGDKNRGGVRHMVLRSSTGSGKKRLRRKLLASEDDIDEDEAEVQVGNNGIKRSRRSCPTAVVNPSMAFSRQGASEIGISRLGPESGCSPVKHGVGSLNQLSSLKQSEEAVSATRNRGSKVMEGAKTPPREPSRSNKYINISDVESDAETQLVESLSTDTEGDVIENREDEVHQKKVDHSLSENVSNRSHTGKVGATEVVRKETIVQRESKVTVNRRKEASTASAEAKISQHRDNEKSITQHVSMPQDAQDIYEVELLEIGSDGHEDLCHICGLHGELLCCDGCPISVHLKCVEPLVSRLPQDGEDWYCPVCSSLKTAREAAEAEKAAAAAEEKLKAFQESTKRRGFSDGNSLHHPKQEQAVKESRLRVKSVQSEEPDRASKFQHGSEQEAKLKNSDGRQDSDLPKASLLSPIVNCALDLLKKRGEQDPGNVGEGSLPGDQSRRVSSFRPDDAELRETVSLANGSPKSSTKNGTESIRDAFAKLVSDVEDVRKPHEISPSHVQEVSRNPLAASTSGRGEVGGDRHGEELGENGFGKYSKRDRRHKPGHRRKNLPWTEEEEDALKEGVKRYSHGGTWGFQWKRILEFGAGRFHHTRTDVDLKDKWRNLVKGVTLE